jgi:putative membrane protein
VAWIPGVPPSVAAITARLGATPSLEEFLVSIARVNTANALFSLVALYVIDNPRSGAAAAIQELMALDQSTLIQMIIVVIALNGGGFLPGVPYPNPFLLVSPFS